MKKLLLTINLFLSVGLLAQEDKQLLELYKKSEKDEAVAERFYEQLEEKKVESLSPFSSAMKAVSCFYMAKHGWWFMSKISYFNEGKEALEKAIKRYPENFILRYIRFAAQLRAPDIANYNQNIEEDRAFLEKKIQTTPESIFKQKADKILKMKVVQKEKAGH